MGLAQQGFLVVEEVQSLNVPEGKDVTIKHTILSKEENASVEVTPSQVQVALIICYTSIRTLFIKKRLLVSSSIICLRGDCCCASTSNLR